MRPEMNKQARAELAEAYGKEFYGDLFYEAVEETDGLLESKVAARAENGEVNKDIGERGKKWNRREKMY